MMNARYPNSRRTGLAALIGLAVASAMPAIVLAQETSAIEEVIVTAQKREERLQDVPIAISAISKAQIEQRGIEDVLDLKALAPNLIVSKYPNSNVVSQIAIRGGVTVNAAMYWEPSTGLYLDGVYLGKSVGSVFDVVDLERIEVLRGPQGTLYGRNTMSGAVNLITKKPTGEFGGSVKLELGNYGYHTERVSIDLPKMGIARASFAVRSEKRDGTVKLTGNSPGSELDSRDKLGARFALALDITDNFVAEYAYDYTDVDQMPPHSQVIYANSATLPAYLGPAYLSYVRSLMRTAGAMASGSRHSRAATDWPAYETLELKGHALTLTWQIDEHTTLKSITSKRSLKNDDSVDLDGTPMLISTANRYSDYDQKSQELQLIGDVSNLNYVLGLYYYKDDGYTSNPHKFFFGWDESWYGFGAEAKAAYGQLDWHATEQLTLSVGARYTKEDKDTWRKKNVGNDPALPFPLLAPIPYVTASKSFSDTTPMASVSYAFNDSLNVYLKYSEGFKSGGFNGEAGDAASAVIPYKPEKQSTWELGVKSTLLDGTMQLNAAVFHNSVEDMMITQFSGRPGVSYVRNAGEATVKGFELEATWVPIEELRFQLSYGYLDGEWDKFMEAAKTGDPITDVSSNRSFPHAPTHTANLAVDALLGKLEWGEIRAFLDWNNTSAFYGYAYQIRQVDPARTIAKYSRIDSLGLLNARVSLSNIPLGDGVGEFSLWARNVTDEQQVTNFIDFGPGLFAQYRLGYFQEPRTYGASFSYSW